MNKTRSLFELLKKREILDILIGDISFGELELKNKSGKILLYHCHTYQDHLYAKYLKNSD